MFRSMRNTHLALGLAFFLMALIFAVSSAVIIYRPWFPNERQETDTTLTLTPRAAPRDAALELMRDHGLKGDLQNIKTADDTTTFMIRRPGSEFRVEYSAATGETTLKSRRYNAYETFVQLHVNHGFWHDFFPSNVWALLSLAFSIGLILLGATGIYLWWLHPKERTIGYILIAFGFLVPVAALILTRFEV